MPLHRKRHSADFKAKGALAALSESKTLAELATDYIIYYTNHNKINELPRSKLRGIHPKRLNIFSRCADYWKTFEI